MWFKIQRVLFNSRKKQKESINWLVIGINKSPNKDEEHLNHFSVINILILNFHENCVHI